MFDCKMSFPKLKTWFSKHFYLILFWNCRWEIANWGHIMQNTLGTFFSPHVPVGQSLKQGTSGMSWVHSVIININSSKLSSSLNYVLGTYGLPHLHGPAARGSLRDHQGHSFPKYSKEVSLIWAGKVGAGTCNADSKDVPRPTESDLSGGPRNHTSFVVLG